MNCNTRETDTTQAYKVVEGELLSIIGSEGISNEAYNNLVDYSYRIQTEAKELNEEVKIKQNALEINQKIKNKTEVQDSILTNFGHFYFNFYKYLIKLNIKKQYIFRFIYLCTYLDFDNRLIYGNAIKDGDIMLEKDLKEVLKLGKNETISTKKVLIDSGLLLINSRKELSINKKYCVKGNIKVSQAKNGVRIMENGIRSMYMKSKATDHKRLAMFIEILPYVNFHHNIICRKPEEKRIEQVEPMDIKDICEVLGYDKSNSARIQKDLLLTKVKEEDCICIVNKNIKQYIYVNPNIYYKGNNMDDLEVLINIFKAN